MALLLKKNRGATLIELMIVVAGILFIFAAILGANRMSLMTYYRDSGINESSRNAFSTLRYIEKDIQNASAVSTSYGSYYTSSNTLVLKVPSYDASGIIDSTYDYIVYSVNDDGGLVRSVYPETVSLREEETRTVAEGMNSFSLAYVVHDFFVTTGTENTFELSTAWHAAPVCRVDGVEIISGLGFSASDNTAIFDSAPAGGSVIEFVYQIYPGYGDLECVSEIEITAVSSAYMGDVTVSSNYSVRLRNKR